jgi:hypothetical protein
MSDDRTSHAALDPADLGIKLLGKRLRGLGLVHDHATARGWAMIVTSWPNAMEDAESTGTSAPRSSA